MNTNAKITDPVLHYLVREPKVKSEHPPVIILMHGIGSNEQDLFSFADQLPGNFLVISVRAPYILSQGSYAWYHADFSTGKPVYNAAEAEDSRKKIIQFIEELNNRYHFDAHHTYLGGFSQGAIMSYSVGLTRPDLVTGMAILSGRLLDDIKPLTKQNETLKKLRIFIAHGTNDKVINISYAEEAQEFLKKMGLIAPLKKYDEGHEINKAELADLINWLTHP